MVALVAAGGWWIGQRRSGAGAQAAPQVAVATAHVVRTDLTDTIQVDGSLGYATATSVVAQRGGLVTALPTAGQIVGRGQALYEVDGQAIPLFYGTRPEWRVLTAGVTRGPDVAELNANLAALGFGAPPGDAFTGATTVALQRWQTARGVIASGSAGPGDVAYAPGPLRVATLAANLGAPIQPGGQLLAGTSTTLVVKVQVPVSQVRLVRAGDAVSVTMPDGYTMEPGVVGDVSPVAVTAPADRASNEPTVAVTVTLDHLSTPGGPRPATDTGNLDLAPVQVNVSRASAQGALAVPINALVALAGGGYAVQVEDGSARRLVAVSTGLFAGSLVQVTGTGIDAGTPVVVPSS